MLKATDGITRSDFEKFLKAQANRERSPAATFRLPWSKEARDAEFYKRMQRIKKFSMLHVDVLVALYWLAQRTAGAILELGPYVGGSTVALALGAKSAARGKVITIEPGGAYAEHPHVPSQDIIGDLRRNLATYEVLDHVTVIEGRSFEPRTREAAIAALGERPIGLFFVDADGSVEADLERFSPYFSADTVVVVDDYVSEAAAEKSGLINPVMDRWVAEGRLERWDVIGWGTWVGRATGTAIGSKKGNS